MFGLTEKLKSAAAAGGVLAVAGALGLIGVVWLSIALYTGLTALLAPPWAMAVVGVLALCPLTIVALRQRAASEQRPPEEEPAPAFQAQSDEASAVVRLAQSAAQIAERSPLAGIALTLGAAFMASRNQATAPFAMHLLAEAVERWAAQPPAEKPPAPEDPA